LKHPVKMMWQDRPPDTAYVPQRIEARKKTSQWMEQSI